MHVGLGLGLTRGQGGGGVETHVFVLAGQSNMIGRADFDGGASYPSGTLQYNQSGALVAAASPLDHTGETAGDMGPDVQFAIDWAAANPGKRIVFVPCAEGGTSFGAGDWTHDGVDNLYTAMVARTNAVLAANPSFILGGLLWHQGENDSGNASFETQLDAMLAAFRTDVLAANATTPIVLGGLADDFQAASAGNAAVHAIIMDTPNRVSHTSVAYSTNAPDFDNVHFSARGLRLMGHRYNKLLGNAQTDTPRPLYDDPAFVMTDNLEWYLPAGATLSDGVLHLTNVAYLDTMGYLGWPLIVGRSYEITFTVSNYVAGQILLRHPDASLPGVAANGTVTRTVTAVSKYLEFRSNASGTPATMDVVVDAIADVTP